MKFNIKTIVTGGIVFYVAQFIASMITGMFIHEGVLDPLYNATSEFWRPELRSDPPDMAALMPRWITVGLISWPYSLRLKLLATNKNRPVPTQGSQTVFVWQSLSPVKSTLTISSHTVIGVGKNPRPRPCLFWRLIRR